MTDKIKNTGEAVVLAEFTKKQNISIVFKEFDFVLETNISENFLNIKGYSLHGPYLIVREQDDTEHIFSMENIQRLKLFYTTE